MSIFASPAEHAANPPDSWTVVKVGRSWRLRTAVGGTLGVYERKRDAEADRVSGRWVRLYNDEGRWYRGESVRGWKPYEQCQREDREMRERRGMATNKADRICKIDANPVRDMSAAELEHEFHVRMGLARIRARARRVNPRANAARCDDIAAEQERRRVAGERAVWVKPEFPEGCPGAVLTMKGAPSNVIRGLFFANDGRIPKRLMANAIGGYSFAYGWKIHEAWAGLIDEEYVVHDGDDWVWPFALPVSDRLSPARRMTIVNG